MTPPAPYRSAAADAADASTDRRRTRLLAALALVIVVIGGLTGWRALQLGECRAVDDSRSALRAQAGSVVAQVLSFDGHTLRADRLRARGLTTDAFARRSGLDAEARRTSDVSVRFSPTTVAVVDADATSGTVLIDGTLRRTVGGRDTTVGQTVTADLVDVGGRWLLDNLDVVR